MSNGDVEYMFMGNPDCGICGALAGTTGPRPIPPPHENCQCTSEATGCNNTYDISGTSRRYGPNGECFFFDADITVICWDGSETGLSTSIDVGCPGDDVDDLEAVWAAAGEVAADLAADACPDCSSPNVS
jgi:hypothetical protein